MSTVIERFRQSLAENVDLKVLASGDRYFKEEVKMHGVGSATVTAIARKYFAEIESLSKVAIFGLCDELWKSGYNEEQWCACHWAYWIADRYEPADFAVFDGWLGAYVTNWAACDTLCNHAVGTFVEMYPAYVEELKSWACSGNRWVKRGAAVTLIIPARKGLFITDIFEIADTLLMDTDDLVRKGYGWMLKAASEAYPQEVFGYVMSHKAVMPRTSLRYAIEKLPPELRARAMEK